VRAHLAHADLSWAHCTHPPPTTIGSGTCEARLFVGGVPFMTAIVATNSAVRFCDQAITFANGVEGRNIDIPSASPLNYYQVITAPGDKPSLTIDGKLFLPPPCARRLSLERPPVPRPARRYDRGVRPYGRRRRVVLAHAGTASLPGHSPDWRRRDNAVVLGRTSSWRRGQAELGRLIMAAGGG
jgi:hypothetical protein